MPDPNNPVVLQLGKPVTTTTPTLLVAPLPAGTYTFQLEVTDNLGASSTQKLTIRVLG